MGWITLAVIPCQTRDDSCLLWRLAQPQQGRDHRIYIHVNEVHQGNNLTQRIRRKIRDYNRIGWSR
jgi:hypothetical protein